MEVIRVDVLMSKEFRHFFTPQAFRSSKHHLTWDELPISDIMEKVVKYIRDNNLIDASDKRKIILDPVVGLKCCNEYRVRAAAPLQHLLRLKNEDLDTLTFFNLGKYVKFHITQRRAFHRSASSGSILQGNILIDK